MRRRNRSRMLTTGRVGLAAVLVLIILVPLGSCRAGGARRPIPTPPAAASSTAAVSRTETIQFDTKGVEFGPWLERFIAQVRSNWMIPAKLSTEKGHVVVTCRIRKDGTIGDITLSGRSSIEGFNLSARHALASSSPTLPLPAEYPDESAFFTITFYFNEPPPIR